VRRGRPALLALALLLALSGPVRAARVHRLAGDAVEGTLTGITQDGQIEMLCDGRKVSIPLAEAYRIEVADRDPSPPAADALLVLTTGGSRLYGALRDAERGASFVSSLLDGPLALPGNLLRAVRFRGGKHPVLAPERFRASLAERDRSRDRVFVAGPAGLVPVDAAVERIGPDALTLTWQGKARTIATAKVAAVVFANPAAAAPAPARVLLQDGSLAAGRIVSLKKGRLALAVGSRPVQVPLEHVLGIEIRNARLTFLSDLTPAGARYTPFFAHVWKHRTDRSVGGGPLRLGGRTWARGIGCHTRTELAWDLAGGYRTFAAVIGIDDAARPRGAAAFVVKADGRVLYSGVRTGLDAPLPIALPVRGVKRLTLVTDFGPDASDGDHADWADAKLMK
jgi:hypothetical protein